MSWLARARDEARGLRGRLAAARSGGPDPLGSPTEPLTATAPVMLVEAAPEGPKVEDGVPWGIRSAAAWSWRLIVIAAAVALLLYVVSHLPLVVIPLAIALLLAAMLEPAVAWLKARGTPPALAAALVVVTGLAAVAGTLTMVVQQFVSGFGQLSSNVTQGVTQIRNWLASGPLDLSQREIDDAITSLTDRLTDSQSAITQGAISTASTLTQVLAGLFLVLFATFFFLKDGRGIWSFVLNFVPRDARPAVDEAGVNAWRSLKAYVRATVLVAFIDAVGIGLAVWALGVPLALPISALVFLSAFVPIIGATLSGAVAVLVALVAEGPVDALLLLGAVLVVQQLEGNVLQPLILGRTVSLHPLSIIVAITAGGVLYGITGALVSVPLVAVLNTAIRSLARHTRGERVERAGGPPGTKEVDVGESAGEVPDSPPPGTSGEPPIGSARGGPAPVDGEVAGESVGPRTTDPSGSGRRQADGARDPVAAPGPRAGAVVATAGGRVAAGSREALVVPAHVPAPVAPGEQPR